jgi:hypothetical protein
MLAGMSALFMNPLDPDPVRQQARNFSAQLGELSATRPQEELQPAMRLSEVLAQLLQRAKVQRHAEHKLKASEFMARS